MSAFTVLVTDHGFANLDTEIQTIEAAGGTVKEAQCTTAQEVIAAGEDADGLLVTWAPITAEVLEALPKLKVVIRMGIGVDNVDIPAATERGVAVCNVPDYGIDEVADHAFSLALALGRQLPALDARVRSGIWSLTPVTRMPAFREMTFASAGFGRIGRSVLERARGLKFRLAAYDPFVDAEVMAAAGVAKLSLDELFAQADILSLHLPLMAETHHVVNARRLAQMQSHAVLVNTARGALIDTVALAEALQTGDIAYAGLDVFEEEPLPENHPLRQCPNALLTSHVAWYSDASVPRLRQMATAEILRGLRGDAMVNQLNRA